MTSRTSSCLVAAGLVSLLGCGGKNTEEALGDAGLVAAIDAGTHEQRDAGTGGAEDAGSTPFDAGIELHDAGSAPVDAGMPGACGDHVIEGDELCDSAQPVDCATLGAVWSAGSATCRSDCSGYDVTGCSIGAQKNETIYPASRDARWSKAQCNDQTPFAFQISLAPTRTDKWVVYFEGGGNCDGKYNPCGGRGVGLTSTKGYPADRSNSYTTSLGVILSRDPDINPMFFDANFAFGNYCSSDGWSGTNSTPQTVPIKTTTAQWVFTGRNNARSIAEVLFRNYGLRDGASQLLVTGNSAGGVGAFINFDLFASRMPQSIANRSIAVLASAAWTDDLFSDPNFTYRGSKMPLETIAANIEQIYGFDADPKCLALAKSKGVPKSTCKGGLLNYTAATSAGPVGWGIRTMVAKNRLDQGALNDYLIPYAETTDSQAIAARADYLTTINQTLEPVQWLYAPADPQTNDADANLHGMVVDELVWPYQPPGLPAGQTLKDVVTAFWQDATPMRVIYSGEVPHNDRQQ